MQFVRFKVHLLPRRRKSTNPLSNLLCLHRGTVGAMEGQGLVFLAEAPEGALLSPLDLRKALGAFGSIQSCLPRRNGGIIVTFNATPVNLPASVTTNAGVINLRQAQDPTTTSKGTVFSPELVGCTVKTMLEELGDQVLDCEALKTRARETGSGRFKLTFPGPLPESVLLSSNLVLPVREHIPAPLRCDLCFKYTHHQRSCNETARVCKHCGNNWHGDVCTAPPHCAACNGDHEVTSSDCPIWKRELAIKTISFTEKVSFVEARKRYGKLHPHVPPTPPTSTAFPSLAPATLATTASRSQLTTNLVTTDASYAATLKRSTADPTLTNKPALGAHNSATQHSESPAMERLLLAFVQLETAIVTQNNILLQILAQNQLLIDHLIPHGTTPARTAEPAAPELGSKINTSTPPSAEASLKQPKRKRAKSSSSSSTPRRDRDGAFTTTAVPATQRIDVMFRKAEQNPAPSVAAPPAPVRPPSPSLTTMSEEN